MAYTTLTKKYLSKNYYLNEFDQRGHKNLFGNCLFSFNTSYTVTVLNIFNSIYIFIRYCY